MHTRSLKKYFSFYSNILLIVFNVAVATGFAQETEKDGGIPDAEIVITKDRQIVLPKADRNFDKIPPRQADQVKTELSYELKTIRFNSLDFNPIIRPLKLKDQEMPKIYGNYFSAGFGNYSSPYVEGFLNSKRDRSKIYGMHFFHNSFGSGAVADGNSSSGKSELSLFGKLLGSTTNVGGKFSYENASGNFYGYLANKIPNKDTLEQHFNRTSLLIDVENSKKSDLSYNLKAGYNSLTDHYKASESELYLTSKSGYVLASSSAISTAIDFFMITREDSKIASYTRQLFKIKPAYEFEAIENLKLLIGANVAYQNDPKSNVSSLNIYPNVVANYKMSEEVSAFALFTGDIDKVSLQTISNENFWLNSNQSITNTNRALEFSGGMKGKLANRLAFESGLSLASLKGLYFYQNDLANRAKFDLTYETGSTNRTNLFADLAFNQDNVFRFNLRADYFSYSRESAAIVYHRPSYKIGINSTYNVYNKILFTIDFIGLGGMKARDVEKLTTVELSPAVDLGFKADYLVSKTFSVFLKFNNLLSNNYQLYLNYPVRGFQAMGGISCSF